MKTKWCSLIAFTVSLRLFASPEANEELVAHEWGTFTSVQGADGIQLDWNPLIKTDLPGFVYDRGVRQGGFRAGFQFLDLASKGAMPSFVRMETPVIYFYSDTARTADVLVNFPNGRITEWYPQATKTGPYATTKPAEKEKAARSFIEWSGVKILPRGTKEISAGQLITEKKDSANHYYAARETDANFLRMESPHARSGAEYDNLLFYRGVGMFQAPLTINLYGNEDQLQLVTKNSEPLTDLFVLTIHNGQAKYQYLDRLPVDEARSFKLDRKPFAPLSDVRDQLMREMTKALVKRGLFEKEATAMVNTWKDQWFAEEGMRVLYLLPREWTDRTLPLEINPRPAKIVRVMVGRAEIITPTMEWELLKQVVRYGDGDAASKQIAVAEVKKLGLGRFTEPAIKRVLGTMPSKAFAEAAWTLGRSASEEVQKQPAVVEQRSPETKPLSSVSKKTAALSPRAAETFGAF